MRSRVRMVGVAIMEERERERGRLGEEVRRDSLLERLFNVWQGAEMERVNCAGAESSREFVIHRQRHDIVTHANSYGQGGRLSKGYVVHAYGHSHVGPAIKGTRTPRPTLGRRLQGRRSIPSAAASGF